MESCCERVNGEVYTTICADLGPLLLCPTHVALTFGLMLEATGILLTHVKMRLTAHASKQFFHARM